MLIIGPQKTYRFFFQWRKAKGTACFFGGILLVLYGWAVLGIVIEGWGFLNLFGDFFPVALGVMRNMPIIGNVLALPPVRAVRALTAAAHHPAPLSVDRWPLVRSLPSASSRRAGCPSDHGTPSMGAHAFEMVWARSDRRASTAGRVEPTLAMAPR